ncbi:MAG: carbon storage regulator [Bacteroidales bacterium]|nr:carbon storage regulator [Bacteroidales bacterium]
MLVLSHKVGEQVIIGDNIRVTVVSLGPGRVKIGIEAPESVAVNRQEIYDRKVSEVEAGIASEGSFVNPILITSPSTECVQKPHTDAKVAAHREPSEGPDRLENRISRHRRYSPKPR